nr:S24 family peptidase [Paenibacillus tritici]
MVQIPIYGEIRAGYNSLVHEDVVGYEIVAKDSISDGEYFFLIVKGDSMIEEGISEGMRVLVKKQRYCQHGKIGVVIVNGEEGTLKRVFYEGDNIILQAANKSIPPKVFPIDEVLIQGQVTKVEFDV